MFTARPGSADGGDTKAASLAEKNTNIGYECPIDKMQQLSSNKADGSAEEAALSNPSPVIRAQFTSLGSKVAYTMRRVISREDRDRHDDDAAEQESAGLMSDQTLKSDDYNEPVLLAKTNSGISVENLSYAMKKVFSKQDDDWQDAMTNREVDGLISTPQAKSSGYELRKFKSTPPKGLEKGYAPTKRTRSYDNNHEEKYAMVKSKSFKKMGGGKTRRKRIGKTSDDTSVDSSSIFNNNAHHRQDALCISKKFMFALMSACVLMSVGAYFLMMTHYNPASARDPEESISLKSYSSTIMMVDNVEKTVTIRGNDKDDVNKDEGYGVEREEPTMTQETFTDHVPDTPPPPPSPVQNTVQVEPLYTRNFENVTCEEDEKWFKLELITDNAGNETSWELERMGDGEWRLFSVSKPHESKQIYLIKMCIPPADYRFTIRDAGNNGMCCGNGLGSYSGYLRGARIFESPDGDEDWGERVHTFTLPGSSESTANTTSTSVPTTSSTFSLSPIEASSTSSPPNTSTPTMPPRQESTSPTLALAEEETLSPTNPPSHPPSLEPTQEVPLAQPTNPPSLVPSSPPTLPPSLETTTTQEDPSAQPTNPPSLVQSPPSLQATQVPSVEPTNLPSPPPTLPPTMGPPPTPPPTDPLPSEDTVTKIFFVADCPYDDKERNQTMPQYINDLESDGDFLVHLGDLMYAVADRCREGAYSIAAEILGNASMPTFVLPGDNDMNDCPSVQHGEEMWMKYFHLFDKKHWNHSFDVTRWGKLDESFGFLHKGVLYLGLNMVGGTPYSWTEKTERHAKHLEQVKALFEQHKDKFEVIVLMKHADPGKNHRDFFGVGNGDGLFIDLIRNLGKPTIHLHGDSHYYYEREADYGVDNYMRISLVGESNGPPLSVTIDVSKPNPITVSRRQSNLRVDCCADGWPRQ
jgi:hypothetical protein